MSASTQNYVYRFGHKLPNAKEAVVPKERMKKVRQETERYLRKGGDSSCLTQEQEILPR